MTIEARKLELINWIANLDDENLISEIEEVKTTSLKDLPNEIVELLKISDQESAQNLIEHTSSKHLI